MLLLLHVVMMLSLCQIRVFMVLVMLPVYMMHMLCCVVMFVYIVYVVLVSGAYVGSAYVNIVIVVVYFLRYVLFVRCIVICVVVFCC